MRVRPGDLWTVITSRFAMDAMTVLFGKFANLGLGFATTLLLIRMLGPEQYGIVATSLTFLLLATMFMDFGTSVSLVRFAGHFLERQEREKAYSVFGSIFYLRLAVAVVVVIAGIASAKGLSRLLYHRNGFADILIIALAGAFFASLFMFVTTTLQTWQRFRTFTLLQILDAGLKLLLVSLLMIVGHRTVHGFVNVYVWVPLLVAIAGWFLIPRGFLRTPWDHSLVKGLFHFSKWNMIANFCLVLFSYLDILMLAAMRTQMEVGFYSSGQKIAAIFQVIITTLVTVLLPYVSRLQTQKEILRFLRKILVVVFLLSAIQLPVIIFSESIITLLAGPEYQASVPIFNILFLDNIVMLFFTPFLMLIYALNRPDIYTFAAVIELVCNVIGNLFLIPRYGAVGAAMVTLVVRIISILFALVWIVREWRSEKGVMRSISTITRHNAEP